MTTLICIDNGGTLTDAIAMRDGSFYRAKALTTPHDLSRCFIDAIAALSQEIYGEASLERLLGETRVIRYSTTQGTNALVQAREKGPRLGLLLPRASDAAELQGSDAEREMFAALVGARVVGLDEPVDDAAYAQALIDAVNVLLRAGANRLVLALHGDDVAAREQRARRVLLRCFPRHFLGAPPLLLAHQLSDDAELARRAWSALLNAFLHPTMEHFLYNAENELRQRKMQHPLMVFRNDGNSSRVAKTVALKTYSSGPRGGMEGARVYAEVYGFARVVTFDVGGTTTDIGVASPGEVGEVRHGQVEGVETAFALCDIRSAGIGGSSVLGFGDGSWRVGPRSVGAVPGPACFGRGGSEPTITDVYLLAGYFDPETYFGGRLRIDRDAAERALIEHAAQPAAIALDDALLALDEAYHQAMARAITAHAAVDNGTVLMAFGGAGPMSACKVAERAGVDRVIVPHAAAVFCAYGIGFSDVRHHYQEPCADDAAGVLQRLLQRARRDMFFEGFAADECSLRATLHVVDAGQPRQLAFDVDAQLPAAASSAGASIEIEIVRRLERFALQPPGGEPTHEAQPLGQRVCLQSDGSRASLPLYDWDALRPGACGAGPALLENAYTTMRVLPGWRFELSANRDLLLTRTAHA